MKRKVFIVWACIYLFLFMNVMAWVYARDVQARWTNVPPVPSQFSMTSFALGDEEFAYRIMALMLQNMGDYGGRTTPLQEYNYDNLGQWFRLASKLDPISDHVPYIAAFYFSAVQTPSSLPPLIEYLREIGRVDIGEKWRWLAQAAYLTQYKIKDSNKAYEIAEELASLDREGMPSWAKEMPAFIKIGMGEREAAIAILISLLQSSAEDLDPAEVNNTLWTICVRLDGARDPEYAELCESLPESLRP